MFSLTLKSTMEERNAFQEIFTKILLFLLFFSLNSCKWKPNDNGRAKKKKKDLIDGRSWVSFEQWQLPGCSSISQRSHETLVCVCGREKEWENLRARGCVCVSECIGACIPEFDLISSSIPTTKYLIFLLFHIAVSYHDWSLILVCFAFCVVSLTLCLVSFQL